MPTPTGALVLEPTADGSMTLFSEDFGEWFHSRQGAYTEAYATYVEATGLASLAQAPTLALLDVCYGLGYNTAAALDTILRVNPACQVRLVALELDPRVPRQAVDSGLISGWPAPVQACLQDLASTGRAQRPWLEATLLWGDARQRIQAVETLNFQADVIFFDPFSPPHCPELWTVEFIQRLAACLHPKGKLVTYSCAAAVRTAFRLAGLSVGPVNAAGRRWPGTLAQIGSVGLAPLSQQEQEHLLTRAAVPYRDLTLRDSAAAIHHRRQQEQAVSDLVPTSRWRKRWLPLHQKVPPAR
ncbi:tRNA (5-methylaminomethyl-2-thiouridine)(34)-methyltransferase MnmD [Nodosilinea sp. LEGE 06152]|uniref:tRNA (5-methylaminomethyl-2-thiouridine)(34)-methyltransferase MnmD n=1 Tax=Nodosilinea sp. LEGE 06152 TaxID=2777966 RepID=UPI00187E2705|nr:MnmC family methyltransferase [Nodosilinea sp. LEGE 06152]MBE9155418.1 tRNA (5-methylaminomethyl-2-thiouridine)(34)-methyltransferase MnmD [Nodosilinea sp. LEGE 06152]